jgi:hypothetical protein
MIMKVQLGNQVEGRLLAVLLATLILVTVSHSAPQTPYVSFYPY